MGPAGPRLWAWLAAWRGAMFLIGGGAGLVAAVLFGLDVLDVMAWWRIWALAQTVEYLAPFIGLVGLYPDLRDRTPRLARLNLAVAIAAIALLSINRILLGVIGHDRPFVIVLLMVGAMIAGFLGFGLASLRTAVPSRRIGGLFVLVGVLTVLYFGVFVAPVATIVPAAVNVGVVLVLLAIGNLLRGQSRRRSGAASG